MDDNQGGQAPGADESGLLSRRQIADRLPFFLRAWWMRDYQESADLVFHNEDAVTMPLGSLHSDPFCDAGCIDYELP